MSEHPSSHEPQKPKGFMHKLRRSTLGRNPEEFNYHEKKLEELKWKISKVTQESLDALTKSYKNEEVRKMIIDKHGPEAWPHFEDELNGLQILMIEAKSKFFEKRRLDQHNDIHDLNKEGADLKKELHELVENSPFRELAEEYGVWGHESVEDVISGIHRKIHRAA